MEISAGFLLNVPAIFNSGHFWSQISPSQQPKECAGQFDPFFFAVWIHMQWTSDGNSSWYRFGEPTFHKEVYICIPASVSHKDVHSENCANLGMCRAGNLSSSEQIYD